MSEPQSDILIIKKTYGKADFFGKLALSLSLWFGVGLTPKMPGTFGTLASVPLAIIMIHLGTFYEALFLMGFILIAFWAAGRSQKLLGRDDPQEVVIDEVAGFLLTVSFLPLSWLSLSLGFLLFRFFDILKPFPISSLEKIRGGGGIVLDDLLAGVYANLCVRIFLFIF